MRMNMILFDSAFAANELKAIGVAVVPQTVGGSRKFAVADTPEVRDLLNTMKGQFDWSQVVRTNHLCF